MDSIWMNKTVDSLFEVHVHNNVITELQNIPSNMKRITITYRDSIDSASVCCNIVKSKINNISLIHFN